MPTSSTIRVTRTRLSSRDGDGVLSWDLSQDIDCTAYGLTAKSIIPFARLTFRQTPRGLLLMPSFDGMGCKTYRCVTFSNGRIIRFEEGLRGPVSNLSLLLDGVLACDFMAMGAIALHSMASGFQEAEKQTHGDSPDRLVFLAQQPSQSVFGVDSVELQSGPPDLRCPPPASRPEPSQPYRVSLQCTLSFMQ